MTASLKPTEASVNTVKLCALIRH